MIKNKILGFILTALLGIVSGLLGGGLGLGAATIALPGFLILGLVPNIRTAIGTTLLSSVTSYAALYKYYKSGNVELPRGLVYIIFYIIGAYYGASINLLLSHVVLSYSVAVVHFLIGIFFLYQAMK